MKKITELKDKTIVYRLAGYHLYYSYYKEKLERSSCLDDYYQHLKSYFLHLEKRREYLKEALDRNLIIRFKRDQTYWLTGSNWQLMT